MQLTFLMPVSIIGIKPSYLLRCCMVILSNDYHPKNQIQKNFESRIPHFARKNLHRFPVKHFVRTQRSRGFEVIWGEFLVCKVIDSYSSFKFRAPKQIWNSVFTYSNISTGKRGKSLRGEWISMFLKLFFQTIRYFKLTKQRLER